jgi:hypothetical protein
MLSDGESIIKIKRTTIPNRVPELSSLELGELALNLADGKIFFKKNNEELFSFLNSDYNPFTLNIDLSSFYYNFGNNTISEIFSSILNGLNNNISGAASTITNGENNEIQSNFSFIGSGNNNKILSDSNNSFNAAGSGNLIQHQNVFTLGSDLTSHSENFTYVNNLSSTSNLYVGNELHIGLDEDPTCLYVANNKVGINTENPSASLSVNGDIEVSDDIEVTDFNKGIILKSPNNKRWRITISNSGHLNTTLIH